jgi:hypothetical protein
MSLGGEIAPQPIPVDSWRSSAARDPLNKAAALAGLTNCLIFATLHANISSATIAPHEKPSRKRKLTPFDANQGALMRQARLLMDSDGQQAGYTFFFQIATDGERRACCVKVDAPDIHEASALFREKWPVLESMARDGIKTGTVNEGVITLVIA